MRQMIGITEDKSVDHKEFAALMDHIVMSLREAGYDPYNQLTGYLQTGDPTYITRRNGAREQVVALEMQQIEKYLKHLK